MTRHQLFTTDNPTKWAGSTELVVATTFVCQWCGPTFDLTFQQPALFSFGGYGATDQYRVRGCLCGALRTVTHTTTNPRLLTFR